MQSMSGQDDVNAALADIMRTLRALTATPRVRDLQVKLGTDANGRDAAFIVVIVEDQPSGDPYPWSQLKPINDVIWKGFNDNGVASWPYVEFRLHSEEGGELDETGS